MQEHTLAYKFGTPLLDLTEFALDLAPRALVSERLIRQHQAYPLFKRGNRLFVAMSDPTNLAALDDFKFHTGLITESIIVDETALTLLLNRLGTNDLEEKVRHNETYDTEDAPIVQFVHKILMDAIEKGASDIHFEPYENNYRIRLRQDGILYELATPPITLAPQLATRLKVMANLDIAERRLPQDGRFKMQLSKTHTIDFRVSTCPTLFGEKIVMRILDPSIAKIGIDALGYEDFQKKIFLEAIHRPQGMVLVTGPTGSGKTVSLYTALNILNTSEVNISTAEDPVEIYLPGVNQLNVNLKAGLNFSKALRSFLRQDPDIVMIGEIRDLETAETAIKAAHTGHRVLSTLHTNSAPETLMRMMNMGVAAFNLATSVSLIIAQRLARRLCEHCKTPIDIPRSVLLEIGFEEAELKTFQAFGPKGCHSCTHGYKGRVGLFEVMPISEAIGRIIMAGGNALDIAEQMKKEGGITLRQAGLNKVKMGLTSLEEITRVTKL